MLTITPLEWNTEEKQQKLIILSMPGGNKRSYVFKQTCNFLDAGF